MGNSAMTESGGNGNWRAMPTGNAQRWHPAREVCKHKGGFWTEGQEGKRESLNPHRAPLKHMFWS